jgi:hypothetical protein
MAARLWFYAKVLDNQDPLNLGRIRANVLTDDESAISGSEKDFNPLTDKWTIKDPFVFNSLLPVYIYAVPKNDELVQVYYHESTTAQFLNGYYISGPLSRIQNIVQEDYNQSGKYTDISGIQILGAKNLRNVDGTFKNTDPEGVFPNPGDVAILGRGSTDLILQENTVLLRAGKYKGELISDTPPSGNSRRSFLQLSNFQQKTIIGSTKKFAEVKVQSLQVNFLIEYDITNPENNFNLFSGAVRLYRLKSSEQTSSRNIKVDSDLEPFKILSSQISFNLLGIDEVIAFINQFIQDCNSKLKTKSGIQLFSVAEQRFPIYYRPTNRIYNLMKTTTDTTVRNNITTIFQSIKLNPNSQKGGYNLIYQESKEGEPVKLDFKSYKPVTTTTLPETYATLGGNYLYLLSSLSQIPGKQKINFENSLYGIQEEQFSKEIFPRTSSAVRGEELLELLNLIVRFMVSHEHGFPGEPPVPVTQDGSTVSNVLQELNNAYQKVLSQYIRLN